MAIQNVHTVTMKSLKQGEFFKRVIGGRITKETYTRGPFNRSAKRFEAYPESDASVTLFLLGAALVVTEFEY